MKTYKSFMSGNYTTAERVNYAVGDVLIDWERRLRELTTDELISLSKKAAQKYQVHSLAVYAKLRAHN